MRNKIVEIANEEGITGLKRVTFYAIGPVVAAVSFAIGYAKGIAKSIKK